jgi:leukotriene-A4 hydrolase
MRQIKTFLLLLLTCCYFGCNTVDEQPANIQTSNDNIDYHTQSNYEEVSVTHLDLNLAVNFEQKQLSGVAKWTLQKKLPKAAELILDTYHLLVDSVKLNDNENTTFKLAALDSILGQALHIAIKNNTTTVSVYYRTKEHATALQWLDARQTFNGKLPFLYTQSQSIYARSWIPCQDGPGIRFTYNASIQTPKGMLALMSASNQNVQSKDGIYNFVMQKPIPAYLMALAVGDITYKDISPRSRIYAESSILDKAVMELSDLEKMIQSAENLYGPYAWERYDVLFMPLGFPFGGMENPMLTFSTPTILAGDKSLVNLIAHELAHSWSGNLVTNQTWNDFWLNESFTVYFERRIAEALYGKEYADMLWELGYQDLKNSVDHIFVGDKAILSKLKLSLKGQDPDLGLSDIAYEKGAHLLLLIEQQIGRADMDQFLKTYFDQFKFKSINTQAFEAYMDTTLFKFHPNLAQAIQFDEWIDGIGLPNNCPRIVQHKFAKVDSIYHNFKQHTAIEKQEVSQWSTNEWLHFLRKFKKDVNVTQLAYLDSLFHITQMHNAEIATVWYVISIKAAYEPAMQPMHKFLASVGRMKFLEPIYEALGQSPKYKNEVWHIYNQNKSQYHPLTQKSVEYFLPKN